MKRKVQTSKENQINCIQKDKKRWSYAEKDTEFENLEEDFSEKVVITNPLFEEEERPRTMDVNQVLNNCSQYKADFSEAERRLFDLITFVAANRNNMDAVQNRMLTEARHFYAAQELSWSTVNDMSEISRLVMAGFTNEEASPPLTSFPT